MEKKVFSVQTVRVPTELEKTLKHHLADRDESFQGMAMRLIRAELASEKPNSSSEPVMAILPAHRIHLERLQVILESGDQSVIDAVTQNIDVFFDRLRPIKRRKTG